jgi:hypothetical protein
MVTIHTSVLNGAVKELKWSFHLLLVNFHLDDYVYVILRPCLAFCRHVVSDSVSKFYIVNGVCSFFLP